MPFECSTEEVTALVIDYFEAVNNAFGIRSYKDLVKFRETFPEQFDSMEELTEEDKAKIAIINSIADGHIMELELLNETKSDDEINLEFSLEKNNEEE